MRVTAWEKGAYMFQYAPVRKRSGIRVYWCDLERAIGAKVIEREIITRMDAKPVVGRFELIF